MSLCAAFIHSPALLHVQLVKGVRSSLDTSFHIPVASEDLTPIQVSSDLILNPGQNFILLLAYLELSQVKT